MGGWYLMKITDFSIIYILIVIPLLVFSQWKSEDSNAFINLNHQYDTAMTVATQDAMDQLRTNIIPTEENGYASAKFNRANAEPALQTFLHTLSINFGVKDSVTQDLLSRYVPVFAVMDYDGALLSVYQPIINQNGENELKRVWLPKIPFTYHDQEGNIISFTLDDYVSVYDATLNEWIYGNRKELINDPQITIPLLHDGDEFHRIRKDTIVNVFQEELAYYINEHNVYTKQLGITYKFMLPLIEQEDWYNTVDDISIFAFFQGYPYERGQGTFNEFALAGGRLEKVDAIHASTINGEKFYFSEACGFNYPVDEIYSSKKAAAKEGYVEKSCLNIP